MDTILLTIFQTVAQDHGSFDSIVAAVQHAVPGCEEELIRERVGRLLVLGVLDIQETEYGLTERGTELWKDFRKQFFE